MKRKPFKSIYALGGSELRYEFTDLFVHVKCVSIMSYDTKLPNYKIEIDQSERG